ncbi:S8 family serine peptidase [Pseudonocardia sp.]|uniref:S8 family serine peptidase n=1 Tax=Pseudonocardia sp. TaxID=60912 RepID=UPI003D0F02B1
MSTARRRWTVVIGLVVALAGSGGAAHAAPGGDGVVVRSRTVLVHGTDTQAAVAAVQASGMRVVTRFRKVGIVVAQGTATQAADAGGRPGVTRVETPRDVGFAGRDARRASSHQATRGHEAIGAFRGANGSPLDGTGVSIAVIDSGIDPTHPSFAGGKVVANLDCDPFSTDDCADAGDRPTDDIGHGTHVAGIAAGREVTLADGTRVSGAAPGASIVSLAISTNQAYVAAMTAFNWVLEHHEAPCGPGVPATVCPPIRVTSNSYGPGGGGDFDPDEAEAKLQRALAGEGVVTVWANGNDGGDGSDNRSNPPGQDPTPGVLSVAGHTDHGTGERDDPRRPDVAAFSSRGRASDPATWPDVSAPGEAILSSCRRTLVTCIGRSGSRDGGNFVELSGTSFAAPHVAGAVAQLFQMRPSATPAQVEDALKATAFRYDGGDGYSRVGPYLSSFDKGTGLIDVVAAAQRLRGD